MVAFIAIEMSSARAGPDLKSRKRSRAETVTSQSETPEANSDPPAPPPPKAEGRIRGVLAKSALSLSQPQDPEAGQTDLKYLLSIGCNNAMECPICAARMCTRTSLKKHLNSHLKGAKIRCQLCDARFQTDAALKYHRSSAHNEK